MLRETRCMASHMERNLKVFAVLRFCGFSALILQIFYFFYFLTFSTFEVLFLFLSQNWHNTHNIIGILKDCTIKNINFHWIYYVFNCLDTVF